MSYLFNPKALTLGIYNGVTDTQGGRITLETFAQMRAPGFVEGEQKKRLPCVSVGGVYTGRKLGGLVMPSGLIQIDIDAKDNPEVTEWAERREHLAEALYVAGASAMVSVSASGAGVFALVFVPHLLQAFEEGGPSGYNEAHKQTTFEASQDVASWTGLRLDRSVINRPNGLRFTTADKSPCFVNWPGRAFLPVSGNTFESVTAYEAAEA